MVKLPFKLSRRLIMNIKSLGNSDINFSFHASNPANPPGGPAFFDESTPHFTYNPFSLSTAKAAWQNGNSSPLIKGCKVAVGAIYDIYVRNPYHLTVGNYNYLLNPPEPLSKKAKVAIGAAVILGALYTLMLYGMTLHLHGRGLQSFGSQ